MTSRRQILALVSGASIWPLLANAAAVPQLGICALKSAFSSARGDALVAGLRAHGYVVGRDVHLDVRFLTDGYEKLPNTAQNLIDARVNIIVAFGATATLAVTRRTSTVPVVFVITSDPVALGIVNSLARPGRNATGIFNNGDDMAGKRLQLLKQIVPSARRVGLLVATGSQVAATSGKRRDAAARALDVEVHAIEIERLADVEKVIGAAARYKLQGLLVTSSTLFASDPARIVDVVARTRLPAVYGTDEYLPYGGLIYYGPNYSDSFKHVASHVARILKGALPAEIPVEQATEYELILNRRTARAQGIVLPPELIARADKVIE